ncbi:MAG: sugar phosphate isomerase/epimerase family protein [Candidatus Omnitrophota bacterium]
MNPINRRNFIQSASAALAAAGTIIETNRTFSAEEAGFKTKLKKAVGLGMLPGKMPLLDRLKMAVDVGFQGIEAGTINDPKQVEALKEAANSAGIEIHSIMNAIHWDFPFSSPNPDDIDKGMKGMETSLRNAKALGATTVLLVPGVVTPKVRYADAYTRSQTHIRKLLPLAQELGIIIGIENVWNNFLLSPLEFARYVDEFNSPFLKAYFDAGNIVKYGFPQDWIRTLGPRIVKVHIKGYKKLDSGWQWTNVRDGSIDWPEVRSAFEEIGYNGYMTAELGGGDRDYLADLSQRMDLIIAGK